MKRDQVIFDLIEKEHQRQLKGIELIASENFVSDEVMEAMGSYLTNKYAEGYPGKRYYGGCQVVDEVETLAIERVKKLFGAEYANVQPHSGAQANAAVLLAVLKPGDTFLGLNLAHGGHLSHGSAVNTSGILYHAIGYDLDKETGRVNYDQMEQLVHFTNFNDSTADKVVVRPNIEGFQMDMSVSIDEQAHIVCALNSEHTNYIDLIGGGDLTLHYDPTNSMNLRGRYTLNSGQMKYSLDMIPLRTFNIQEGSYIEFTGDPMNPTLNITATENIKATYTGGMNDRIVNFTTGVKMTNNLARPGVEFIVEAPEDLDAQNNLNTMSAEEKAKIAVTLLASGMYLADGSGGTFAMNNALASFMQTKINDISGRALSSMGLDITANMESTADASGSLHTDYTLNFSKRLWNNRLRINMGGRVSTGSQLSEENGAYFDNFSLEYRLNKNETQYLKLYYEREAYDWLEGQLSEFGAGFMWRRKLQHFKDIFRFKPKKDNEPLLPNRPDTTLIRFKNEKK